MNEEELRESAKVFVTNEYWIKRLKPWLEQQSSSERLVGANLNNFESIRSEIVAYRSVLSEIEKDISIS